MGNAGKQPSGRRATGPEAESFCAKMDGEAGETGETVKYTRNVFK